MSLAIENKSNIRMPQSGASVLSTSTSTSSASKSAPIQMIDSSKNELLKKLGITLDQYNAIKAQHPDFDTLSLVKQLEIVKTPIALKTELQSGEVKEGKSTSESTDTQKLSVSTSENKDIKAEYNKKDLNGKIDDCYSELAKNIYIYGANFQGKTVKAHLKLEQGEEWDKIDDGRKDQLVASAEKEWNALSDEEKQIAIDKIKTFVNTDKQLKEVKDNLVSKIDDKSKEALVVDKIALDIKSANYANISYPDFLKKDELERLDIIEQCLRTEDPESLTSTEKFFSNRIDLLNRGTAIKLAEYAKESDLKKQKEDPTYKPDESKWDPNNYPLDFKNTVRHMKCRNFLQDEAIYAALQEKVKSKTNLTDDENKAYTNYKKQFDNQNFQGYILDSKAKNLENLQTQYNSLNERVKKGETLSDEEQRIYRYISETLEEDKKTGEKSLLKHAESLPKPKNDYDKNVVKDLEAAKVASKNLNSGSDTEAVSIANSIEANTKGMSHSEKLKYIKTALKYNFSASSIDIVRNYLKEFPELLQDINAVNAISSDVDKLSDEQASVLNTTVTDAGKSKNERDKEIARRSVVTEAQVLSSEENRGKSELDNKRLMSTSTIVEVGTTEDINAYGINVAASVTDAKKSEVAISTIYNSDKANDDTYIEGVKAANKSAAGAFWVVSAGQRSAKATAYTAENNIIAGLNKKEQTAAYVGTHKNINKHFEGKDAIKYSNALSDQIQYCDKDNQLAMHNEMMTSKYSEVQEHTARNIKNYDLTVQADALSTVYKSGNEKAIAVAVNEVLPAIKSPDAQQIALKQAVMELAGIVDTSELQAKFANGALTKAEIAQLSPTERREYYTRLFDNASPAEKIKYLKSIPSGKNKATIYSLIGKYYPTLFKDLIKTDAQIAKDLYSMTNLDVKARDAVLEVIMNSTTSDFVTLRADLRLNADKDFALTETEPVTAKTINNSSIPKGFDTKEIYPKDKKGFYYV